VIGAFMPYSKDRNYYEMIWGSSTSTPNLGAPTVTKYGPTQLSYAQARSGSSLPNWGSIIAKGGNATTDYDATYRKKTSYTNSQATVMWGGQKRTLSYNGDRFLNVVSVGNLFTSVAEAEEVAAHAAASSARSSFNSGAFLGELRETMAMIKNPAMSLQKLTHDVHRKAVHRREWYERKPTWQRRRDADKALSDLHLEFQFGWKPLASDIGAAVDAANRAGNNSKSIRVRGFGMATHQVAESRIAYYNVGDVNTPLGVYASSTTQTRCIIKGNVALKMGFGMPAFQAGSTIPDFIPSLWELMPWSFLIDYFSNVGKCLETRAFSQLVTTNWMCKSTKTEQNTKVRNAFFIDYPTGQIVNSSGPSAAFVTAVLSRRRLAGLPIPSMQLNSSVSTMQGLNIAALIHGRLTDWSWKAANVPLPKKR
jgi:hypothetical protein